MLNIIYNTLGIVSVQENKNTITVRGVNGNRADIDISNEWNTSKIYANMMRRSTGNGFEFDNFFAIDLLYVMQKLANGRGRLRGSRRQYESVARQLLANTWLRNTQLPQIDILDFDALKRFTWTPLEDQLRFLQTYNQIVPKYKLKGYILGAAPGSGKTFTGFCLSECLNTDTTILLVPKNSLDRVWRATIDTVFKEVPDYWISSDNKPLVAGKRYYIAHYEQLDNIFKFASANNLGKVNIVIDESHNFNDLKSARTQQLCELVKITNSISTIFSSGTPVKAMGSEVIPIMRCIDSFFNPNVEERFKKVFGLSTSKALDILANRMGLVTFKVDKAAVVGNKVDYYDVDVKMPTAYDYTLDKIRTIMTAFIEERMKYYKTNMAEYLRDYFDGLAAYENTLRSSTDWTEYKLYRNYASVLHKGYDQREHVAEALYCNRYEKTKIIPSIPQVMRERFKNAKSVYKYYHLKVQGEALGRVLGRLRVQCNVEMIHAMDNYKIRPGKLPLSGEELSLEDLINQGLAKTVIFTSYVEVVTELNTLLSDRGFKPLMVYGDTNKNLAQIINDFEKIPDLNPIIATYPSLSTAVPLIMANQGVMLNAPFRVHEYEQSVSRMDRLGQKESINIFNIYLDTGKDTNISTRSVDIMAWSKSQVEAIMGTGASTIAIESMPFDQSHMSADEIELVAEIAVEHCDPGDMWMVSETKQIGIQRVLGW